MNPLCKFSWIVSFFILLIASPNANAMDLDSEYKKALYVTEVRNGKGEYYYPSHYLITVFSVAQLKEAGFSFFKKSKNDVSEIEKAVSFLVASEMHKYDSKSRKSIRIAMKYPERIYAGLAAKKLAEMYSDINNKNYDLDKALYFHGVAGDWEIQSSSIAEGYLSRFIIKGKPDEYDFKYKEIRAFRQAAKCTKEKVTRELMPYKEEFCTLAQNEAAVSEEMELALTPSNVNKNNNKLSSGEFWGIIGLIGLAALAAGGESPNNPSPPDYINNSMKSWNDAVNRAELEFAFTD